MKILALDSSASPASVVVMGEEKILSHFQLNIGLTHSQTLLPMVQSALSCAQLCVKDMDLLAVSVGPGSFTGVRIGVATVKGLCFPADKPCVGVSTLEAMAYNFLGENAVVFALMDARRSQVYYAIFRIFNGQVFRLAPDRAVCVESLKEELASRANEKIIFVGDGAALCYTAYHTMFKHVVLASENLRYQDAYGVAMAAKKEEQSKGSTLMPTYLRLPQAERELKLKSN